MTHKKQHSECAIPLGIKWVGFQCGIQKCCGLLQEDDAVYGELRERLGPGNTRGNPGLGRQCMLCACPPTGSHGRRCPGSSTLGTASELAPAISKGLSRAGWCCY